MFGHPVITLSSLEVMKECNFASSDDFSHRPVWLTNFCNFLTPGLVFKGAQEYHVPRKFIMTNLKRLGMGKAGLEPRILEEANQAVTYLNSILELDPQPVLHNFTMNVIMTMCFGKRWDYGDPEYTAFAECLHRILQHSLITTLEDLVPILRYLPPVRTANKESSESVLCIRRLFEGIVQDKISGTTSMDDNTLVDAYLDIHKQMSKENLKDIIDICQDLFIAGSDTSSATINFAIIHMLNNLSWQDEVSAELDTVLQGRSPSMADLQLLPKLEATLQETFRMNPNAPLIIKATEHAVKLREYIIPSNCMVQINAYHINHDPASFPDPTTFSPKRWLHGDGTFRSDLVERVVTFGVGRRACIGRPLARMEMTLMLARLLQEFRFIVPEGEAVPSGTLKGDSVVVSPPPYRIKLVRRDGQ
jgi:cytochrome P450 family 2 subfamily U polypeptide 1